MIFANVKNGKVFVNAPRMNDADRALLSTIPNRATATTNDVWMPYTLIAHRRLTKLYGDRLELNGDGIAIRKMKEWAERFEIAHQLREAEELPPIPVEKSPAWRHQQKAFWFGRNLPFCTISAKMGAGKSKSYFDIICNDDLKKVLVTTTASCVDDWPLHALKHSTKPYVVLPLGHKMRTLNATRKAEIVEAAFNEFEYLIVVVSYDTVWRPPLGYVIKSRAGGGGDIGLWSQLPFDIVIADEVHRLADPMSRASLFMYKLGLRLPRRIGGTGTVIRHKPENAFGVYRFIDPALLGDDYEAFLDRYCIFNRKSDKALRAEGFKGDPGQRFIVDYQNLDELGALLSRVTYHVDNVNLDLPKPIHTFRKCYLSMAARKAYDQLESDMVTTLEDGTEIVAPNKLTSMLRLRQATGGFVGEKIIDPETGDTLPSIVHEIDKAKEELLEEVLSQIDTADPVVVVGIFKHDIEIIRRVAAKSGRTVYEQSGKRKQLHKWQAATGGEVLVGQVASICEGVDLTRSSYMVIWSIGFSVFQYLQLLARIDRPGQTRRPTYTHLIADQTIDEKMYAAIERLQGLSEEIIYAMKQPIAKWTLEEYNRSQAA